jgi:hypothetical protein
MDETLEEYIIRKLEIINKEKNIPENIKIINNEIINTCMKSLQDVEKIFG